MAAGPATVYFVARRARAVSLLGFTFAPLASGAAAAFTEIRRGVDEVLKFGSPTIPGDFTFIDKLDGSGPSGNVALNKQKGIIYEISAGHLGHRGADYFVMNPTTRVRQWFGRYNYMDTSTASALQNPTMYVAWGIETNGSTTR